MTDIASGAQVRADIWLWAARFFKTRSLAKQACEAGHVSREDQTCKPARMLRIGDRLTIRRGEERFEVQVAGLSEQRGPASAAQALYIETGASIAAREAAREQRRLLGGRVAPPRKPDKNARRALIRLHEES